METISALLLAISPVVIATLTNLIKKIPVIDEATNPNRTVVLRTVVAVLSLGASIGSFAFTGVLDEHVVEIAVGAVVVLITTLGTYALAKKKNQGVAKG